MPVFFVFKLSHGYEEFFAMETTNLLPIITALASFGGIALGIGIGVFVYKQMAKAKANSAEAKVEQIISDAKNKEKELLIKAKEKALKIIEDAKKEEQEAKEELKQIKIRLEKRESLFDQKLIDFEENKQKLQQKADEIKEIREKIENLKQEAENKLQQIAGYSTDQAKEELLKKVEQEHKEDIYNRIIKLERAGSEIYEEKARELVVEAIQRCASNHASETTSTVVNLPSDDMKGRIIGKDGRNIKTIEKLTGCELIIDDTPEILLISGFSPIRRRVCQIALEKLIKDGRIQPARIEEFIDEAKKELALDIKKAGEEALYNLGITGLDPKFISIVGRLKYRTSYGQNVLNHSIEVAHLSAIIASELGLDATIAKRAGFFHDIGKAVDQETKGGHPEIGETILKKFEMDETSIDAARHHHDDKPENIYTQIVKAADAISSSRVGARRDSYEQYVARLEELEKTASQFTGIEKVYAIQAGREVRIFIKPEEIDDYGARELAKNVAKKIEEELKYPGEIKVNVIRETRVVEYAR